MLGKAENFIDYCLSQLFKEIKSVYAPCQPPCYYKQCNMVTNVQLSKDKDLCTLSLTTVCAEYWTMAVPVMLFCHGQGRELYGK